VGRGNAGAPPALGTPALQLLRVQALCTLEAVRLVARFSAPSPGRIRAPVRLPPSGSRRRRRRDRGSRPACRRQVAGHTYGSARWADDSDIRRANLLGEQGVVLGLHDDRYLRHNGPEHILAVAPTRSGKGVGLLRGRILRGPSSLSSRTCFDYWKQNPGAIFGDELDSSAFSQGAPTTPPALVMQLAPKITVTACRNSAKTPPTSTHDVRVIAIVTGRSICRCL
jgi:Type IV secretory system Conjugative DNA transfer